MQPTLAPTPGIAEATRAALGQELENYLAPLVEYCDTQRENDNLSEPDFRHVFALRQAIDALLSYDEATETLLHQYRQLAEEARQAAPIQVPTLNAVVLLQAWRQERNLRERLSQLYAQHATLPTPPDYVPSPLIARVNRLLATPHMQAYAALPLATRQALNTLTPADLHAHVEPRKAQA